ncbi:restriction endonuclease [Endozoicomonas sp. SM1973]|uniref:Restriction endonuclease n=1 Tax=Spartinivicinus marinus TaxID=2994442 RepID=A0A853I782_9GAMM|nr:restriction endonuclease [Spartinivicinus marinus]MCX4025233.1 restriction endonuclease [Spartinivicinus marinus]NYZ65954.1 restriction endonuclease [Spartinivicinus marinus]
MASIRVCLILPWWAFLLLAPIFYSLMAYYLPDQNFSIGVFERLVTAIEPYAKDTALVMLALAVFELIIYLFRGRTSPIKVRVKGKDIRKISWREFELLVAEAYRRKGYRAQVTEGSADDGIDVVLKKGAQITLVQCKHWKNSKVGVKPVRELLGVITAKRAHKGIFVTSGTYTRPAIEFAQANDLTLLDGEGLQSLLAKVS